MRTRRPRSAATRIVALVAVVAVAVAAYALARRAVRAYDDWRVSTPAEAAALTREALARRGRARRVRCEAAAGTDYWSCRARVRGRSVICNVDEKGKLLAGGDDARPRAVCGPRRRR